MYYPIEKQIISILFPNKRLLDYPKELLERYKEVFTVKSKLERIGYFSKIKNRRLKEKRKIAIEAALLMFHPRVQNYITAYPNSLRLHRIMQIIKPWHRATLDNLKEIRSEIIAMHSEGSR